MRRWPSSSMIPIALSTVASRGTATMSVRGVITSPTVTSSRRITLVTTFHSSSSMVPSRYPIWARTSNSARLTVDPREPRKARLKKLSGIRIGFMRSTIQWSTCAAGAPSCGQNVAPMVFGTISEKSRMINVRTPVKTPIQACPKTLAAMEPPKDAPAV